MKRREQIIVTLILAASFIGYSFFPWQTQRQMPLRFNSPDEAANYFFTLRLTNGQPLAAEELVNQAANNMIHPRSTRLVDGRMVPASFAGLPVIYGLVGYVTGPGIFVFLTAWLTSFALLAAYACWRRWFGPTIALLSVFLMAVHPAIWYYASRGFYHNVLFLDLLIFAIWSYGRWQKSENDLVWLVFSAFSLALSLLVRTSEILWVAPLALAALYYNRRQLTSRHIIAIVGTLWLVGMAWIWYSFSLYHQLLPPGYGTSRYGPSAASFRLSGLPRAFLQLLAPFGFSPSAIFKNFLNHGLLIFAPLWGLVFAGVIYDRGKKIISRGYIISGLWVTFWLAIYYGSWQIADSLGFNNPTVGNSYVRYWLPIYVVWLPYAALALMGIANYLRDWGRRVWYAVIALFIGAMCFNQVYFDQTEGLAYVAGRLRQYRLTGIIAEKLTSPDAVIIGDRADKSFFPERRVIVSDGRPVLSIPEVLEAASRLADSTPLYFY